jgi:hypothetical protein
LLTLVDCPALFAAAVCSQIATPAARPVPAAWRQRAAENSGVTAQRGADLRSPTPTRRIDGEGHAPGVASLPARRRAVE